MSESEQKYLPTPEQLQGEMEQYLSGPEAEKNEKTLSDALIAKAKLEELGVPVPDQLQVQIDELQSRNPLSKVPKWATKNEWIKVIESRKQKLQAALKALGDIKPGMRKELEAEIARIDSALIAPKEELGGVSPAEYAKSIRKVLELKHDKEKTERTLTPEQAEQLLKTLEKRFNANKARHEKVDWEKVKSALEANPEALWSINEMEKAGHEPDVYFADDEGFDVGTCCKESPRKHRDIYYDKEAARLFGDRQSAVEIAKEMRIDLMTPKQYTDILQAKGEFDTVSSSWLKTHDNIRTSGDTFLGSRGGPRGGGNISYDHGAHYHSKRTAFRGSLRVLWS